MTWNERDVVYQCSALINRLCCVSRDLIAVVRDVVREGVQPQRISDLQIQRLLLGHCFFNVHFDDNSASHAQGEVHILYTYITSPYSLYHRAECVIC